jgi:hypothetical protein
MLNCEQATRMMSESQERDLGVSERTVLRMHKWICSGCRNFGGQLGFLRQAMKGFANRSGEPWPEGAERDDEGGDQPPDSAV